ncbi:protein of unknown function [Sterolibacterium denitrificans]|uniref:Uncharacterized protein n=1 Tax=Sterolibacterium denitrificans TaxID=157592 RepID=A0A7Z7HRU3_9PROT|nr:hypothetical protein [Sterolibacterium denitrificans]SMB28015.1 protein of unknown function [Sterolibacterium denitrificans]
MYPLALVTLGAALVALWLAWIQPDDMQRFSDTRATAHAANFWAYRQALVAYQNAHFQDANGYIDYGALSGNQPPGSPANALAGLLPPGFVMMQSATNTECTHNSNPRELWSHWFAGGRLYTFSCLPVEALPGGIVTAIANDHGRSLMIGIRQGDRIKTLYELNIPPYTVTGTFFPDFPPQIPEGAFVVIGN